MKKIRETEDFVEWEVEEVDIRAARIDGYVDLQDLLVGSGACASRSAAWRLIKQRAVEIDKLIEDVSGEIPIRDGAILKVGKRFWRRLKVVV